jgi:hypothetical protein
MFNIKNSVPSQVWDNDWIQLNLADDSAYIKELAIKWNEKLQKVMANKNL